ncbi:FRG domain-containing protein [Citreimonas salinaria]|uniref:FRG domain-containing protein n=1 Tax=Citreimonas salinaria TaxID=321339 RepID=A0A1H3NRB7_9RHOB|nr:FRG domain-containing protein [Citreimonas salinaria]SDY90719.1 FRG domain-containing protein [Citreimonas salinaria]
MGTGLAAQWIGFFAGTNNGLAMLDLDEVGDHLIGGAYAYEDAPNSLHSYAPIKIKNDSDGFKATVPVYPIDPRRPKLVNAADIPAGAFSNEVTIEAQRDGETLNVSWESDLGTKGRAELIRSQATKPSQIEPARDVFDWASFQSAVEECLTQPRRFVFRGQSAPWRLRTAFHRTARKDLARYWHEDIPRVRGAVVGKTGHRFRFEEPEDMGAFMHLLQHHGYPTPLLDWTYSPFVAAFFAYSSARPEVEAVEPVRIFMFDALEWQKDFNQIHSVTYCRPHFSLIEPLALGNERAIPQQSLASVTNLDDVETYIRFNEQRQQKNYLRVFDLPAKSRHEMLARLSLMGISPGSMFPGLEGVCREFRERNFGPRPW